MDTPERNQIGTPLSKFEDSPVFNYINSLSPIKPVKSIHITQTFSSLSFTSPPSVFTSPHVSYPKESRFLRRHCFPETKPYSSERRPEHNTSGAILDADQVCGSSAGPPEIAEKGTSVGEGKVDHTLESSELAIELPRTLKYDCGSPEGAEAPNYGTKAETVLIISETPEKVVRFVQETTVEGHHSFESCTGLQVQNTCQHEQTKEVIGCDWENLISDTSDLLAFDSPNEVGALKPHDNKLVDPQTSLMLEFPPDTTDNLQKTQPVVQVDPHEHDEMENPAGVIQEVGEQKETDHTPHVLPNNFQNKNIVSIPSEKVDDKASGHFINVGCKLRGIRRRCLVFESASAQKKKLEVDSSSCSSVSSHSEEKAACDDKSLVPIRTGSSSSPCILPGIGLHLNALAASTKDLRIVKHETVTAGKQLISVPSSSTSFHSLSSECKSYKSLAPSSIKTDVGPAGIQITQDASRASAFKVGEDFSESSPKKKRRRLEQAGESESACKRCNCKKSKCLKLYCECFAAGVYCVEPCSCQDCFNKPVHEDTVLATRKQIESRNPLAFAPKVIRSSESNAEIGEESNKTPASARHKRGCNCKKSSCLKKYCECYQGGVGCSINCRCEGCKNAFGRKDGSTPLAAEETEPEEEEMETSEKVGVDKSSQNSEVHNSEEQYPDHVLPITFSFQICRTSVKMPLSIGKPPQSSLPPQPRFEKHFQIVPDDETPEILRNCSPISGVKTSPNCKRVSPPHNDFVSSPGRRSSRKLILRSIPAFPSLSDHETSDFQ